MLDGSKGRVPAPSIDQWELFADRLYMALNDPKEYERRLKFRRRLAEAHSKNSGLMRLRGSEYDEDLAVSREVWVAVFEAHDSVIRMQAGL